MTQKIFNFLKTYSCDPHKIDKLFVSTYLNLNNIMLKVFSFNERAICCYKKVGFKEMGIRRQAYYLKGKVYDEIFMDIVKCEWERK